jgi:VCBS repeat-containing protein
MSTSESTTKLASAKSDTIKTNIVLVDAKAGNDRVTGGSAAQTMYGGSGNDVLQGAGGDDILWGDGSSTGTGFVAGTDSFVFEKTLVANGLDTVMDFGIAGHKANGVLQAGSFVADTLDLSRIKFTGLPRAEEHEGEHDDGESESCGEKNEADEEVHITAANANDYIRIQGGDLFIDTDGLGAGQGQIWAHLQGVSGGDLVNLKFDDFRGQIEAQNALASITGNAAAALSEDDNSGLASGILSVADTDRGENTFQAATGLTGSYGDFGFDVATGIWSFALDNAAAQALHADESVDQLLTVKSLDGTATQSIKVTVQGAQDAAVITGDTTGAVTEDAPQAASGTLNVADADHGESSFLAAGSASLTGNYGDFSFDAASGAWTYTLDNQSAAVQALATGEKQTDSLTVATADGTQQVLTVSITGTNDVAVITGDSTGVVTEDGTQLSQGRLNVSDAEAGQSSFQAASGLAGSYGAFSFGTNGSWSYLLDSTLASIQALRSDERVTDVLTVSSLDGSATQTITVTVSGSADRVSAPTVCLDRGDSNDNALIGTAMLTATEGADTLIGTRTADTINGLGGNDVIYGVGGDDRLIGEVGNDTIYGGPGDDFIAGRLDNDILYGGSGNDEIAGGKGGGLFVGGLGADKLVGGTTVDAPNSSSDIFKFIDLRDTGDTIYLFDAGRDKLDFSMIDADTGQSGKQAFSLTASLEIQAHGVNWFVEGGNTIVQFDNDGNTGEADADFEITLVGNITLTAANFTL